MADQNTPQTPQVGVVGQQGRPAQAPQQAPAPQGVPGVQGPPVPSPEQIAKVMAAQAAATQKQIQTAQKRAGYDGVTAPQPAAQTNNRFSNSAPQNAEPAPAPQPAAQQQPPQQQHFAPQPQHQQPAPQPAPSPISGMTAEQVIAGPPRQPVTQPPQQQGTQFSQFAQPQETTKESVFWFPVRGPNGAVEIELTDYILKNVPAEGVAAESDPGAKVVLVLFSEILALREKVDYLLQNAQQPQADAGLSSRVHNLEQTLFHQRNALNQSARGVREQIDLAAAQGLSPEQILATLSGQQAAAQQVVQQGAPQPKHTSVDQQAAAQANMVAQGTGQSPESQQVAPASEDQQK